MKPSAPTTLLLLPLIAALVSACEGAQESVLRPIEPFSGKADGALLCEQLSLPELQILNDNGSGHAQPPRERLGVVRSLVGGREAMPFSYGDLLSLAESGPFEQEGWLVEVEAGESYRFEVHQPGVCAVRLDLQAFGPIMQDDAGECETGDPIALSERAGDGLLPDGTWTPSESGVYFISPEFTVRQERDGTLVSNVDNASSCYEVPMHLQWRRLHEDGGLDGQTFVEAADWSHDPFFRDVSARFDHIDDELVILARGKIGHAHETEPRLVVIHTARLDEPLVLEPCESHVGDLVVGDFDGDGRDDLLSGANLFVQASDGSFVCEPSGFDYLQVHGTPPLGGVDVDHDGRDDLIYYRVQTTGSTTNPQTATYVLPYARRDGEFVRGQWRKTYVPISASGNRHRAGLVDLQSDGDPEVAITYYGRSDVHLDGVATYVFEFPVWGPQDETYDPDARMLDLVEADIDADSIPRPEDLGVLGPQLLDVDGDGLDDHVAAGRVLWSRTGLATSYGRPDGGFDYPWWHVMSSQLGHDRPSLDHADINGDGCPDLLVGGAGLSVLENRRCRE